MKIPSSHHSSLRLENKNYTRDLGTRKKNVGEEGRGMNRAQI